MPEEVKVEEQIDTGTAEPVVEGEPTPEVIAPAETPPVEPEAPVEEPAKDPNTEEFYQTKYQELKKSYDDATQKLDELGNNVFEPQPTEIPAQEKPVTEAIAKDSNDEITMEDIRKMFREEVQQARSMEKVSQEFTGAQAVVNKFIRENNVPDEHLQRAVAFTKSLGINEKAPGGAASLAKSVIAQLQYLAVTERFNSKVTQAGATATEQAKLAQLTTQPDAGAMPQPGELTKEEKDIRDMNSLQDKSSRNELFNM